MSRFVIAALGGLCVSLHSPEEEQRRFVFEELGLAIELPGEVESVQAAEPEPDEGSARIAWWDARLAGKRFALALSVFDAADRRLYEPGDVTELVVGRQREGSGRFDAREHTFLRGPYGHAPFASLVEADVTPAERTDTRERHFILGGLLEGQRAYALHLVCEPPPDEDGSRIVRAFFDGGITFTGATRDPLWSNEEILDRWVASTPEELHGDFERAMRKKSTAKRVCIRTEHYLILTNSSGGKLFARKMEENYDRIAEAFPFAEVEGRRLMPVFLFKINSEYYAFNVHNTGADPAAAARSKGYAWKDYYATWYEAPEDPVHIHEQTHQIFANRLRLGGGGSWFQEGVAEYIETSHNDRNVIARLVRDGDSTPLRDLVQLRSLLHSTVQDDKGGSRAGDHYKQAALLIEFLREGKFGKGKFEDFLYTLGKVSRGDVDAIDAGFRKVYGTGIEGVEEAWREYCRKR